MCRDCVKADRRARYVAAPDVFQERNRAYAAAHKDEAKARARGYRTAALMAYGNQCACCGDTTPEFLAIDHVNNDGEAHRREMKGYGRSIYDWLRQHGYPQDGRFQVLCHNCNMSKGLYGGCPHQGPVPYMRHRDMVKAA